MSPQPPGWLTLDEIDRDLREIHRLARRLDLSYVEDPELRGLIGGIRHSTANALGRVYVLLVDQDGTT